VRKIYDIVEHIPAIHYRSFCC